MTAKTEIEFSIDHITGKTTLRIKGIRGKACRPIHKAVSDDLKALLGIPELSAEDTAEARDIPNTVSQSVSFTVTAS